MSLCTSNAFNSVITHELFWIPSENQVLEEELVTAVADDNEWDARATALSNTGLAYERFDTHTDVANRRLNTDGKLSSAFPSPNTKCAARCVYSVLIIFLVAIHRDALQIFHAIITKTIKHLVLIWESNPVMTRADKLSRCYQQKSFALSCHQFSLDLSSVLFLIIIAALHTSYRTCCCFQDTLWCHRARANRTTATRCRKRTVRRRRSAWG